MAILNLNEYYSDDNKKSKTSNNSNNGNEDLIPINQKLREPLLQGLDSKYIDQETSDEISKRMKDSISSLEKSSTNTASFGDKLGNSLVSSSGQVLDFASTAIQLNSNVAKSDKEADARTGQLALKGAGMGASVGSAFGPLGTAIGAVGGALIGGTVGMLKKVPDRKKRLKASNEEYNNRMFAMTNQTNQMAERSLIQEELQNQQNLAKAQMGLLNLKY